MKKILAMFAAVACAAVLSACNDQKAESKTEADESLNKVKAAGEFVLGLDDSFPPMGFRDKDNNIVGFDIDLATEVCARLGVKLKTQPISWDAKEQELNTGKIDCIWNGMSVDSARAKAMNLSDPYLKNRMIFTVKDKALANLAALAGKKIAVQNQEPHDFHGEGQGSCKSRGPRWQEDCRAKRLYRPEAFGCFRSGQGRQGNRPV